MKRVVMSSTVEIKSAIYLVWVQKPFLFFYPLAVGSFCAHQSDWDWTTIWQSITRLLSWHQPFLPWIGTIQEDSSIWVLVGHLIYLRFAAFGPGQNVYLYFLCLTLVIHFFISSKCIQSNLAIRNVLLRNLLVLRNHFPWPNCHLLHMNKEHLALRNNFRVTKKFLIAKFDCTMKNT